MQALTLLPCIKHWWLGSAGIAITTGIGYCGTNCGKKKLKKLYVSHNRVDMLHIWEQQSLAD
jgi:hypothetical protein